MTDKLPQQADGGGRKSKDATGAGHDAGGESGGGAYPNPHKDKAGDESGPLGHGGQTDIGHYGGGDIAGEKVGDKQD